MHNNTNYQCKICWNKALTFGVGLIQLSFCTIVFTQYMQKCFQSIYNYTFQSNCAEGLHFSAFHFFVTYYITLNLQAFLNLALYYNNILDLFRKKSCIDKSKIYKYNLYILPLSIIIMIKRVLLNFAENDFFFPKGSVVHIRAKIRKATKTCHLSMM